MKERKVKDDAKNLGSRNQREVMAFTKIEIVWLTVFKSGVVMN